MKIPKRFQIFGKIFTVHYDDAMAFKDDGHHGQADYRQSTITLLRPSRSALLTREDFEHNFCHELVHHILYLVGEGNIEPPLHTREFFVDRLAGALHQALTTMEYK